MRKIVTNNKSVLNKLLTQFKKYFGDVDNVVEYAKACDRFSVFVFANNENLVDEYFVKFVKEYYVMKNGIVNLRNELLEYLKSKEFEEEKWLNRILLKLELRKQHKLCNLLNRFEQDFYNQTGVSLLAVENERFVEEQQETKEQAIKQ